MPSRLFALYQDVLRRQKIYYRSHHRKVTVRLVEIRCGSERKFLCVYSLKVLTTPPRRVRLRVRLSCEEAPFSSLQLSLQLSPGK